MKNKVVINACYGGFHLSVKAMLLYAKKKGIDLFVYENNIVNDTYRKLTSNTSSLFTYVSTKDFGDTVNSEDFDYNQYGFDFDEIPRHDKILVEVVEELGERASSKLSKIEVREINGNMYRITEYDGYESVETPDTTDWTIIEK